MTGSARLLLCVSLGLACRSAPAARVRHDSAAGAERSGAPVIRGPSVVAFRLRAADTLADTGGTLLDDFHSYTELAALALAEMGVALVLTSSDSLVVERPDGPRRVIMLGGLDFPFGYVLVEPGYPETILTGVSTEEELLEQVDWYFGVNEERPESLPGRVTGGRAAARARQWPTISRTRRASSCWVNGLWRNEVFGRSVPCWRMASSVYPET
jgi:hypothetical protein